MELTCVLYGGEPLLQTEINFRFISKLKNVLKNYHSNVDFRLSIITNGYLFNKDIIIQYKKHGLIGAQITLDGNANYHNKRRFLINGKSTYTVILENILNAVNLDIKVSLRINVDDKNVLNIPKMLQSLRDYGLNKNISISISPVFKNINVKGNINDKNVLEKMKCIFEKAADLNFAYSFPTTSCSIFSKEFFAIDYLGNVYNCPSMAVIEQNKIGDIYSDPNILKIRFQELSKKCSKCIWVPLCAGGCTYQNYLAKSLICMKNHYELLVQSYIEHYSVMNRYING